MRHSLAEEDRMVVERAIEAFERFVEVLESIARIFTKESK